MAETNKEFLASKLANFKAFLRQNSSKPEAVDEMDAFTIDHFLVFGAVNLMPLSEAGRMDEAVTKTVERYALKTENPEIAKKVLRYYEFLVAFLNEVKSSHQKRE